eukprot:scaffold53748_cov67-Phaeocystis_antarctica.AAC.2
MLRGMAAQPEASLAGSLAGGSAACSSGSSDNTTKSMLLARRARTQARLYPPNLWRVLLTITKCDQRITSYPGEPAGWTTLCALRLHILPGGMPPTARWQGPTCRTNVVAEERA